MYGLLKSYNRKWRINLTVFQIILLAKLSFFLQCNILNLVLLRCIECFAGVCKLLLSASKALLVYIRIEISCLNRYIRLKQGQSVVFVTVYLQVNSM